MKGTFEKVHHTTYSGETHVVPLWVPDREALDDSSVALLRAANIIGREGVDVPVCVPGLISETARVRRGMYDHDVMVADNEGGGAIIIGKDRTKVTVGNAAQLELPTELFAQFLEAWADYHSEQGLGSGTLSSGDP